MKSTFLIIFLSVNAFSFSQETWYPKQDDIPNSVIWNNLTEALLFPSTEKEESFDLLRFDSSPVDSHFMKISYCETNKIEYLFGQKCRSFFKGKYVETKSYVEFIKEYNRLIKEDNSNAIFELEMLTFPLAALPLKTGSVLRVVLLELTLAAIETGTFILTEAYFNGPFFESQQRILGEILEKMNCAPDSLDSCEKKYIDEINSSIDLKKMSLSIMEKKISLIDHAKLKRIYEKNRIFPCPFKKGDFRILLSPEKKENHYKISLRRNCSSWSAQFPGL